MASTAFVQLSGGLVEAMGQRLDAAKPVPEGLVLRTGDGFLYAFLEDPDQVSLDTIRRVLEAGDGTPSHLVVLTPGHLPLAIQAEIQQRSGTLVEGARFAELARQLGLESLLGEAPRPPGAARPRLLPSAQLLDGAMQRARTWLDWGVPALALRFYRHASELKPGFLPAKIGIGRSLLGLGLTEDADRAFTEVIAQRPNDLDAWLGKAAVLGARAKPKEEIEVYRALLAEDEARVEVRAHLVAALVELGDWSSARVEVEAMLRDTPEDPPLRFLHAVTLMRTGEKDAADRERDEARHLGLSIERETALCLHLGLPPPAPPSAAGTPRAPRRARAAPTPAKPARRSSPRPKARAPRPASGKRDRAGRKRK
ncbi:MAG TPA: tetratricopeptide repeat protein [Thermoplasmata archaeon]|nr:tetratricopeptide repeat protein [Thermoplasmata archaeon]